MLQLALEPEAASIYVQYLPMERNENGFGMTKKGTKYMVVDIGGMYFQRFIQYFCHLSYSNIYI